MLSNLNAWLFACSPRLGSLHRTDGRYASPLGHPFYIQHDREPITLRGRQEGPLGGNKRLWLSCLSKQFRLETLFRNVFCSCSRFQPVEPTARAEYFLTFLSIHRFKTRRLLPRNGCVWV